MKTDCFVSLLLSKLVRIIKVLVLLNYFSLCQREVAVVLSDKMGLLWKSHELLFKTALTINCVSKI